VLCVLNRVILAHYSRSRPLGYYHRRRRYWFDIENCRKDFFPAFLHQHAQIFIQRFAFSFDSLVRLQRRMWQNSEVQFVNRLSKKFLKFILLTGF
jgi:hypothetical protein